MPLLIPFSGRSGTPEQSLVAGAEELAAGGVFREYRSILALSALLFMFITMSLRALFVGKIIF